MTLYRTVSDRGLWKKYQKGEARPQHFHKPNYIDKETPVVTYSQLELGDPYRYTSRQSIPDIRQDINDANKRLDQVQERGYLTRRSKYAKSCPNTPRATTPSRTLSKLRVFGDIEQGGRGLDSGEVLTSAASGQYCSEEDRYSFESRSITAFSNYSERDSVLNENYRYLNGREGPRASRAAESHNYPDNPFNYLAANEGESVVNLFLNNSFYPRYNNNNNNSANIYDSKVRLYPGASISDFKSQQQTGPSQQQHQHQPGRIEDLQSPTPLVDPDQDQDQDQHQQQETSRTLPCVISTREKIRQLRKSFLESEPEPVKLNKPKVNKYLRGQNKLKPTVTSSTKEASAENQTENLENSHISSNILRQTESQFSNTKSQKSMEDKCVEDNPIQIRPDIPGMNDMTEDRRPQLYSSEHEPSTLASVTHTKSMADEVRLALSLSRDETDLSLTSGVHVTTDTVTSSQLPSALHAEVVSVRHDESASTSSSSDDEDVSEASTNIMVNIKPVSQQGSPSSGSGSPDTITPRLEAPPQKQNIWGPGHRQRSFDKTDDDVLDLKSPEEPDSIIVKQHSEYFPNEADFSFSLHAKKGDDPSFHTSSPRNQDLQETGEMQWMAFERNFKDTALTAYQESAMISDKEKAKKKGLFSFFKKNKKKTHDDFIHIEPKLQNLEKGESDEEHIMPDLYGDQSPRFHVLTEPREEDISPMAPSMPVLAVQRALFEDMSKRKMEVPEEILDLSQSPKMPPPVPNALNLPDCVPIQNDFVERGMVVNNSFQEAMHSSAEYSPGQDGVVREVIDFGEQFIEGETDLDQAFEIRQSRSLERKLSMSKPTNLDDLLNEEPNDRPKSQEAELQPMAVHYVQESSVAVDVAPAAATTTSSAAATTSSSTATIPEHERTQEIDIDALLGGDFSGDDDVEEDDSYEIERLTRENTHKNKDCYKMPAQHPTYYPEHKTYTFNGETTFSASPEFSYMENYTSSYLEQNKREEPTQQQQYDSQHYDQYQYDQQPRNDFVSHHHTVTQNQVIVDQVQSQQEVNMQTFDSQDYRDDAAMPHTSYLEDDVKVSEETKSSEADIVKTQHDNLIAELSSKQKKGSDNDIHDDSFKLEEQRLEEEHRMLSSANLALQEQLEAKEIERLEAEKQIDDIENNDAPEKARHKPKSIFNFDNFKKKSKELPLNQIAEDLDRPRSMPKQKSKSGFSFFSSKDKKSHVEANVETEAVDRKEPEVRPVNAAGKPKLQLFTKSKSNNKETSDFTQNMVKSKTEGNFQDLAENIVTELIKSSEDFNIASPEEPPAHENADKSSFSRAGVRASVRQTKNKNKKEESKTEDIQPAGFPEKRSESKSRFSIKMPKKKSKEKETRASPVESHRVEDQKDVIEPDRSRSTTPSQSRPGSRLQREKPSGLAELFGLRSSRRSKSTERPNSTVSSSQLEDQRNSQKNMAAARPRSTENPYKNAAPSQPPPRPESKQRQSLSNYFSHDQSHSPIPHSLTEPDLNTSQDSNRSTRQYLEPISLMPPQGSGHGPMIPVNTRKENTPPRDINQIGLPVPDVMNSTTIDLSPKYPPPSMNSSFNVPYSSNSNSNQPSLNTSYEQSLPVYPPPANPASSMQPHNKLPAVDAPIPAGGSQQQRRQTGRQSGRFRRGGGHSNNTSLNHSTSMNSSFVSQGSNEAQYRFMDSLVESDPRRSSSMDKKKFATVGRVEGARLAEDGGKLAEGGRLAPAKSEESVREPAPVIINRRRGKDKRAGECSVM